MLIAETATYPSLNKDCKILKALSGNSRVSNMLGKLYYRIVTILTGIMKLLPVSRYQLERSIDLFCFHQHLGTMTPLK